VYTEAHEALRESVRRFVAKELAPHVDEWEEAGSFPDDVFRRCGELGFLGLHYPERWGGSGGDLPAGLVFVEELARCGCGAIPMAVSVQTHMATPALAHFGTDEQRARWLAPAIAGTAIGTIAITEPDAGSDVAGLATRAEATDDGWLLNGQKMYITNGLRAQWMLVVARTEPGNPHGVSLFCVDTDLPGVGRTPLRKLGMRSSDTALVTLDDVVVPSTALVGDAPGLGFKQLMWQLQYERMAAAAACIGHAGLVLADTIAFARDRRAFGQPIGAFQVIAHGLADAATELEAVTALYDTVLWRLSQDEYPVAEISMVKKMAAQVQNRLVDWCLQVHGGAGFMHEQPVSRAFRDARLQRIGGGTDQVMNEVIAKRLGISG
jgi:alkylation response protein AidB-like acyl-CoA dehydrogenase